MAKAMDLRNPDIAVASFYRRSIEMEVCIYSHQVPESQLENVQCGHDNDDTLGGKRLYTSMTSGTGMKSAQCSNYWGGLSHPMA